MSGHCRVSEALYSGLCGHIGTTTEVTIRREVHDVHEMIEIPCNILDGVTEICSGSFREGFRFKSSDIDTMFCLSNHKVITELSQSSVYDLSKHSIILMDDTDTPPGYVRLKLLTSPRDGDIALSIVSCGDGKYISNQKWKQIMLIKFSLKKSLTNTNIHGPCANAVVGDKEIDWTVCFHCLYWSRLAGYWRKRCTLHNWPPNHVFDDILRIGCHFVSVGSKYEGVENELEWRISFSQAEQKLVYCMNHTQFLCYGLLKIFLKEVINRDIEEPFLCSYFVKTTMFWLIQIGNITWCPNNLLNCFWKCFKYLLHCVYQGTMPNFFIPQNNMFISKLSTAIGTRSRICVLKQLNGYYEIGVTCLLQSPTVRNIIEQAVCIQNFMKKPLLGHIKDVVDTDICIKREIFGIAYESIDIRYNYLCLKTLPILLHSTNSQYQILTLQKCFADVLVKTSFMYLDRASECTNKTVYRSHRLISDLLKLAGSLGDVSCLLYLALYYYITCRYREALHVTALVKSRLTQPYIIYTPRTVDTERYNETVAGWSLSKRMKKAWVDSIDIFNDLTVYNIRELGVERIESLKNDEPVLYVSPYVVTDMFSVLCNYRLGNWSQCLQSLRDLQTLLIYDDGSYITSDTGDISWQILGICQHVVGDLQGALQSYQQSLREEPYHKIQSSTQFRIALVQHHQILLDALLDLNWSE